MRDARLAVPSAATVASVSRLIRPAFDLTDRRTATPVSGLLPPPPAPRCSHQIRQPRLRLARRHRHRRAEEAGYDPQAVHPHMFRHTVANDWLAGGGSEGDLMRLMGWHDRSMVERYAADMQDQRAFEAKRRRGDMY
jgi:integrase